MRRYSPPYDSPPRRGYGGRGRSPPRRGYGGNGGGHGGGHGGRKEQNSGSLLVRNIPLNCRAEELRVPFERFGPVRDVYLPRDFYSGKPRGFAFIQFVEPYDAAEAQYHMNGQLFFGREITVVVAAETRKKPEEMRQRGGPSHRGPPGYGGGGRRPYYGRSRSRSVSRSRSPRRAPTSRGRYRSRSASPAPRRRADYSVSPRIPVEHSRSPRDVVHERDNDHKRRRSYSPPGYGDADRKPIDDGHDEKPGYSGEEGRRDEYRSPRRVSRSPFGSRSRSADLSPPPSR